MVDEHARRRGLAELYDVLRELRERNGGDRLLRSARGPDGWPRKGVYFFFELGEHREESDELRVVRVGTHAVSRTSRTTLWKRLRQHRGTLAGRNAGGGNHRASIFRRHVGTALIRRGDVGGPGSRTWAAATSAGSDVRPEELPVERAVSAYIGQMPFQWVSVPDLLDGSSHRGTIERNAIGLLRNLERAAVDPPSSDWLGHHAAATEIRGSGLWNVNHVSGDHDLEFLELLREYVEAM